MTWFGKTNLHDNLNAELDSDHQNKLATYDRALLLDLELNYTQARHERILSSSC